MRETTTHPKSYGNYDVKFSEDSEKRFRDYDFSKADELSKRTMICVCTWNRKNVVELCMANLNVHKRYARLVIFDDGSTEYDEAFLRQFADEVHMLERGKGKRPGVHELRIAMAHHFLKRTDFDYLYMTDSDAYHDPLFFPRLEEMLRVKGGYGAYSVFLSYYHTSDLTQNTQKQHSAAGISLFFPRASVEKIQGYAPKNGQAWDGAFSRHLGDSNVLCSQVSYVEHYGKGGFNNPDSWDRVRARCPTKYLLDTRAQVLSRLES